MRLMGIRLGEDLCNIFVTNGGFAHILCQNRAITLSKTPVLGLFWRNNFVTLQKVHLFLLAAQKRPSPGLARKWPVVAPVVQARRAIQI